MKFTCAEICHPSECTFDQTSGLLQTAAAMVMKAAPQCPGWMNLSVNEDAGKLSLCCSFQKASDSSGRLVVGTEFAQGFVEPAPL